MKKYKLRDGAVGDYENTTSECEAMPVGWQGDMEWVEMHTSRPGVTCKHIVAKPVFDAVWEMQGDANVG